MARNLLKPPSKDFDNCLLEAKGDGRVSVHFHNVHINRYLLYIKGALLMYLNSFNKGNTSFIFILLSLLNVIARNINVSTVT